MTRDDVIRMAREVDIADRVRIRAMKACTSGDMELFNLLVEVLNRFESTNRFHVTPLASLDLTMHLYNILARDGVYSIEQLDKLSDIDLLKMPNMGKKSVQNQRGLAALERREPV